MSKTESMMVELGTPAPDFALLDVRSSQTVTLHGIMHPAGHEPKRGLLVMFVCVHCPYVKHLEAELGRIGHDYYGAHGEGPIAIAAIQSNDIAQYPDDGPDGMRDQATRLGWPFPYLLDDTQQVARAYEAACTPDFFLFDHHLRLAYRGQLDDSRPSRRSASTGEHSGNDLPITGHDLRAALDAVIAGHPPNPNQRTSIGCNIKWREAS